MNHLDLFTGIGGFHIAAQRCGFKTIMTSEIDPFNKKLIDQNLGLDNCGDIRFAAVSEAEHPYSQMVQEDDIVPVEQTGLDSLCYEDFMEGVLPWPDLVSGGFPCQDISSANAKGCSVGIKGVRSGLVEEQLRIIEMLEPPFAVFENSKNLNSRGLNEILAALDEMGYIVEFETIAATAFGYPHYRHRMFIVAYMPYTQIAKHGIKIFKEVRQNLPDDPEFKIPLLNTDAQTIQKAGTVEEPRSIPLRTKRINGLGNAIVPDIAEAIYRVIAQYEPSSYSDEERKEGKVSFSPESPGLYQLVDGQWFSPQSNGDENSFIVENKMPTRGVTYRGMLYSDNQRDPLFNPTTTKFKGLYYTLGRKDGNNNGNPSRANRPGGLGGLNGQLGGALNPEWCEPFMGYPIGHTELKEPA